MSELVELQIDGRPCRVEAGTTVAAALAQCSDGITRRSVSGMLRAPLCGMGVCQECRVEIDQQAHRLACQTLCARGMIVRTAQCQR